MSLIPNNSIGNSVNSNAIVTFTDLAHIGTVPTGLDTNYQTGWIEVGGMSNLTVVIQGTDNGLTPDSTVGSALVTVQAANGVPPALLISSNLYPFRIDEFLCPMTNTGGYVSSAITRTYRTNSKFVQILIQFPDFSSLVGNQYIKTYLSVMASA